MKVLGVIPARGGSKGIVDKNIVPLHGRPLIEYTLRAAEKSLLTHCVVSTDSKIIAGVVERLGGNIPFMRPAELARDDTPTLPVLLHVLDMLPEKYDALMILQPTSPFRTSKDINAAIDMLNADNEADSVISVVPVGDHHPARMKRIVNGVLVDPPFAEAREGQCRQDLEPLYLRNGAIYLTRISVLRTQQSIKGKRSLAYVMPEDRSINIDSRVDLMCAQGLFTNNRK